MKKIIKNCLMLSILFSTIVFFSCNSAKKEEAKDCQESCDKSAGECCKSGDVLVIVAHVTAYAEHKDELLNAFKAVVEGTHTEEGNVSYDLYEDINDPLKFTFIEYWKSQEAIDAHNASAHFQQFIKIVDGKADLAVSTLKHKF